VSPQPLVSCIMPTANRRAFVPQAIDYFLRQDYQPKELIIIDDGDDASGDLIPADGRLRHLRLSTKMTVGAKRNLACEQARGEVIAHWDDDDWHAPHRIRYQVEALLHTGAEVCGITTLLFYELNTGRAWRYVYPAGQRFWLSGSTLCYRRAFWAQHRFANINVGEDAKFVWSGRPERMVALPESTFHVGIIHGCNAAPKRTEGPYWHPYAVEEVRRLLGDDWRFYQPEAAGVAHSKPAASPALAAQERSISMITVARETDMALPEYVALNHGQTLPWMRRWEIPFALFQARLMNTMALLDCTINPIGFQERLARLYPHVLYRHWNPIQNGQFAPPFGMPDAAFDRVICINTLEHLLKAQREALIAAMARKLKPGGWLILTSDYYFDAFWSQPAFLQTGVMRADRSEIFNGWNKVTPQEWLEMCRRSGLHPMAETVEEPREDDAGLYRQRQPYAHACIAGVFGNTPRADLPAGKKIVLALLAWNTRDVTMDSARAHVREARMLRRLGQEPFVCVCDNGSSDGLADALQALEPDIDVPHKFILNHDNLGSSIARNQIIDYMLACDADYLLLMDGDIEIVPFSSFAMLRYMENSGHRLGCIGADSLGQTPHRERASPYLYSVDGCRLETTNLVAWTQYGMFRRAIFDDGVRFDETRPFDGAGWGFEDNDLAFQMDMKGYLNQRFFGMTYLHRDVRSSIRIMRARGIDAAGIYTRRKQYVIDKWAAVPHINNGPLALLRRVTM
jgi:glycosyltransferase involved in cell wall biosynthesis